MPVPPNLNDLFALLWDPKALMITLMPIVGALVTIIRLISPVKPRFESWSVVQ